MQSIKPIRLLSSAILILFAAALAACNSSSGGSQRSSASPNGVAGTEVPKPGKAPAKGTIAEALAAHAKAAP
jgi:hypothetical protein